MFNELKNKLNESESIVDVALLYEAMADTPEDDILDSYDYAEDPKEIESLVNKIPDGDFSNNGVKLTNKDLANAAKQEDPTINDLLSEY